MIAHKIIPSFYIAEVEGDAVNAILPGDFEIHKIAFGSSAFTTDMHATAALEHVLKSVTANLDLTAAREQVDFNPEFFPSLAPTSLSDEQLADKELAEGIAEEMSTSDKIMVVISKTFDPLGNFIQSRWSLESSSFKILGKIAVNPETYLAQKALEETDKRNMLSLQKTALGLH